MKSRSDIVRPGEVSREMLKAVFREVLQELIKDAMSGKLRELGLGLDGVMALGHGWRDALRGCLGDEKPERRAKRRDEAVSPLGEKPAVEDAASKTLRSVMRSEIKRLRDERTKR
jgi:hypothetical protein